MKTHVKFACALAVFLSCESSAFAFIPAPGLPPPENPWDNNDDDQDGLPNKLDPNPYNWDSDFDGISDWDEYIESIGLEGQDDAQRNGPGDFGNPGHFFPSGDPAAAVDESNPPMEQDAQTPDVSSSGENTEGMVYPDGEPADDDGDISKE